MLTASLGRKQACVLEELLAKNPSFSKSRLLQTQDLQTSKALDEADNHRTGYVGLVTELASRRWPPRRCA
jgi:hypothetical protein